MGAAEIDKEGVGGIESGNDEGWSRGQTMTQLQAPRLYVP